jgi:uncharacterized protein YjdB
MLGSISGSTKLTVTPPVLVSLAVSPTNAAVTLGKTLPFAALGTFSDGTTQSITTSVSWGSSDNSIATVSQGLATGIAAGKALITASAGSLLASTFLTVNPAPSLFWTNCNICDLLSENFPLFSSERACRTLKMANHVV